ncbi:tautomerase family protein [Tardiphaga sp. P9-11]|uniref:tautomerase family protein n=1 Tax=Tardiphaga sp. P9-11 TaxID=2024614 RepID=UPI0011F2A9D2|nr:tautomerase family protein [Tardiphaga sp. P9-11]KAA0075905.1 tautomerase family protein [Tardiphaga sp. P9-11]
MPLLRFDLAEGWSDTDLKSMLDVTHEVMVAAFKVSPRDRYQIVHEHRPTRMIIEDTGLGMKRTNKVVMLQITTRPRTKEAKQQFYASLAGELASRCGIPSSDLAVNFVTNADEDWSFGLGRAQFLTGEL